MIAIVEGDADDGDGDDGDDGVITPTAVTHVWGEGGHEVPCCSMDLALVSVNSGV